MFMFKNPTGGEDWITCKNIIMTRKEQINITKNFKNIHTGRIVPCRVNVAWEFNGNDFNMLTVKPSIDASESGNWHGFITDGLIVGGIR